jgi:hypothetical protein
VCVTAAERRRRGPASRCGHRPHRRAAGLGEGSGLRHLAPDPAAVPGPVLNGKVAGVATGVRAARHRAVVVADDDVRYDAATLRRLLARLRGAQLVAPQNVLEPSSWHARWDTWRTLVNRAFGMDPPAYDSLAQPARLAAELALLPAAVAATRRHPAALAVGAAAIAVVAEVGRRRHGGRAVYGPAAALWAPPWAAERAVPAWAALGYRLRGGVPYRGRRLAVAAHSPRRLARRPGSGVSRWAGTPSAGCRPPCS